MSGIYLHIPFCKQACHYCDFHFSTRLKHLQPVLEAMHQELSDRSGEVQGEVETIYFGGGTPSLLDPDQIEAFITAIREQYKLKTNAEITLEANPDDLDESHIRAWKNAGVNRLSLGIQSFTEEELKWMNRAHDQQQAHDALALVSENFENYSIDLIYGIPGSQPEDWIKTLEIALSYSPPHISAYALTVEENTALEHMIDTGKSPDVSDHRAESDFKFLIQRLEAADYAHYEISNFARDGFYSKNNSSYWLGKPYLGIGPSAHSYDGLSRRWNVRNNLKYTRALTEGHSYFETEHLTERDRYNEAVMTGLRTQWGVSFRRIRSELGPQYENYLRMQAEAYIHKGWLFEDEERLFTARAAKFLADGIASDLFMLNLE